MSPFVEGLIGRLSTRPVRPSDDGRRRAAVAALVHDASEPRVLLMKRVERAGDPWSGHISLPGGGFHASDGELLATAIRETREELDIDLTASRFIGSLPAVSPFSAVFGVEVTPFVFAAVDAPIAHPGPEAESAFWLPLELARSGALDGQYVHDRERDRTFPSWSYEGHSIWGLTWRILQDLLKT